MRERKLQRLSGYDYSRSGYYYVTIKVKESEYPLCLIEKDVVVLTDLGKIIDKQWKWLSAQYKYIIHDEYVIMPDHFHGILEINDAVVGNGRDRSLSNSSQLSGNGRDRSLRESKIKPLHQIIGAFKTTSSKMIHQLGYWDFKWQKSFYDHILRKHELNTKRKYIKNNPLNYDPYEPLMDN